jgi:protein involved in polysaccharide export with SLBB domain
MPVPADYVLGAGDELLIRGWGTVDIDLRAPIDRGGQIHLPRVGSLTVAGLKAGEVEERWSRKTEHADKWKSCSDGRG